MPDQPITVDVAALFRQAVDEQQAARESAYIECPETLCGVEVLPFQVKHLVILDLLGSPFIDGGNPDPGDVAQFLWIVSPAFEWNNRKKRDRFTKRLRRVPFAEAVTEILKYVADAFEDAPGRKEDDGRPPVVGWPAHLVHLFASEYGWTEQVVFSLPFKRAWQYWRCIALQHDPRRPMFNSRSDRVKSEWLVAINNQNG